MVREKNVKTKRGVVFSGTCCEHFFVLPTFYTHKRRKSQETSVPRGIFYYEGLVWPNFTDEHDACVIAPLLEVVRPYSLLM